MTAAAMNGKICQDFLFEFLSMNVRLFYALKKGFFGEQKSTKDGSFVVVVEVFAAFNEKFDERAPTLPQANHWPVTPS